MAKAYISIDPGVKGSLCLYCPEENIVEFTLTTLKPLYIYLWIKDIQTKYDLRVILIEDVHSIFGTSAKSNFNFGFNTGLITGVSLATGVSVDKVTPKIWQKQLGVKSKGKAVKKEVAEIIERLHPTVEIRGPRGGLLDGLSDSLGIAIYAYHKYK